MPKLVDLLHESGMFVVAEGIETRDDLMLAARSNVDFVQGWLLFGKPNGALAPRGVATPLFEHVFDTLAQLRRTERLAGDLLLMPYRSNLSQFGAAHRGGREHRGSLRRTARPAHTQLVASFSIRRAANSRPRCAASVRKSRASASRRSLIRRAAAGTIVRSPYFVEAHAKPQEVIVSAPHLSVTGLSLCVTLTVTTQCAGRTIVAGTDLDWRRLINDAPSIL